MGITAADGNSTKPLSFCNRLQSMPGSIEMEPVDKIYYSITPIRQAKPMPKQQSAFWKRMAVAAGCGRLSAQNRRQFASRRTRARCLSLESLEWRRVLAATIDITEVPDFGVSGFVRGQVSGVNTATHRVAPFIQFEGAGWWTKPTFANPTVPINSDGTFQFFLGANDNRATIYSTAVVAAGYTPPQASGGGRIPADLQSLAIDHEIRFARTIEFAGRTWGVKDDPNPVGPGGNRFSSDPSDVYVDAEGNLHLTIQQHNGQWWSTEVVLLDSLGHGTYSFQTESSQYDLDINATFGAFTWDSFGDDDSGASTSREIDFEDGRWGNPGDPTNSQMVVQPFWISGNTHRYTVPNQSSDPTLTRFFNWQADSIDFVALTGAHDPGSYSQSDVIGQYYYQHNPAADHFVPTEGRENFRFNLWLSTGSAPAGQQAVEVVISDFDFIPEQVAHWNFDEASGNIAADVAGAGSVVDTGTLENAAMFDPAVGLGGAVRLDGHDDYIDVVDSTDINLQVTTERTISVWVYVDDATINSRKQVIFEDGGTNRGLNLYVHDGRLYVGGWNTPASESGWAGTFLSTPISSGQWHHVALTLSGDTSVQTDALRGYLDGVEFGSGSGSQLWSRSGDIGIGRVDGIAQGSAHTTKFHDGNGTNNGHGLAGWIDDLRIYDRRLDAVDLTLLASESPLDPAGIMAELVSYWDFDEGTGSLTADSAPFGAVSDQGSLIAGAVFDPNVGLGGAIRLDGDDDYVDIVDSSDINLQVTTERTISAWVYVDDVSISSRKQVIVEDGGTYRGLNLYVYDGQLFVGGWNTPASESGWAGTFLSTAISSGQWHHVALTLSGGTSVQSDALRGFLNGVEFDSSEGSRLWSRSGDIGIGRVDGASDGGAHTTKFHDGNAAGNAHGLAGWIDDVRVYDRQLDAAELVLLASESPVEPAGPTAELVAHWDFDEGAGLSAADIAPFGGVSDLGMLAADAMFDPTVGFGGAIRLDGVDDYTDVADSADINLQVTVERTISAWVYIDDATISSRKQVIFEDGGTNRGLNLYVHDGQLYAGGWNTPSSESGWTGTFISTAISSGQWHHVALTLSGDTSVQSDALRGYLDGVEFGRGAGSQLWSRSGDIGIGRVDGIAQGSAHTTKFHDGNATSNGHGLAGWIDELRVYNRQLTAAEISDLAGGSPTDPS